MNYPLSCIHKILMVFFKFKIFSSFSFYGIKLFYLYVAAEIQDIGPQEKGIVRKTESNCDNSSCQVMMLESYVLQLLCVQKVLKDASAQDTVKKV